MQTFLADARHAVRAYGKTPLFTLAVLLILGLGIGANSAIFSIVNAVLLRPLPYPRAGELVALSHTHRVSGRTSAISPPEFFDLREQAKSFAAIAAYWSPSVSIAGGNSEPQKILAATASSDLIDVLGVTPVLGRPLGPADSAPGSRSVALLGYAMWQRRFGGDAHAVGQEVMLDGRPTLVVGVMPEGFDFPRAGTELWVPLRLSRTRPPNPGIKPEAYRQYRILNLVGRVKPGVTVAQARSEVAALGAQFEAQFPDANRDLHLSVTPLHDLVVGSARSGLLLLLAAVGGVLLVACGNVGSLLLVRAAGRGREVTIRMALGADRLRLARQMLTESLVLALAGGALALLFSSWAIAFLVRFAPEGIPRIDRVALDGTVVAFTAAVSMLAGILFGLAPALQVRSRRLQEALVFAGRSDVTGSHHRVRHALVVTEMALSLILLVGAGLLIRSLLQVAQVDTGFRAASVLTLDRIELPRGRAAASSSAAFFDRLLTELNAVPGIQSAAITLGLPLDPRATFFVDETPFTIEGRPPAQAGQRPVAPLHVVSPKYFATIGVPLERGRWFSAADSATAPGVIIINEAMARELWPGEDPIGRRITHDLTIVPGQATSREIVGVVGDVRHFGLEHPAEPQMFVPHAQMPWPSMAVVVRTTLDAQHVGAVVRQSVWSVDASIPVPPIRPLEDALADATGQPRFRAWILGVFASIALLLAVTGLYATIAYAAQQRTREIGLRIALGATPGQATAVLVRNGLQLAAAGILLGMGGAVVAGRLLSSMLYGVSPLDPVTFVGGPVLVLVIAMLACYIPARRARHLDPIAAIRIDT
jgi:putative ABC transport system permease protein